MILNKLLSGWSRDRKSGCGLRNRTPNILTPCVPPIHLDRGTKEQEGNYY